MGEVAAEVGEMCTTKNIKNVSIVYLQSHSLLESSMEQFKKIKSRQASIVFLILIGIIFLIELVPIQFLILFGFIVFGVIKSNNPTLNNIMMKLSEIIMSKTQTNDDASEYAQTPNSMNKKTQTNDDASEYAQTPNSMNKKKKIGKILFVGLILLLVLYQSIIVIGAGETGVVSLFGKVRDEELRSGIHLVNPLVRVQTMSIRTEQYTMTVASGEGQISGDDSIKSLTKEGLDVNIDFTALYRLDEKMMKRKHQIFTARLV